MLFKILKKKKTVISLMIIYDIYIFVMTIIIIDINQLVAW